MNNFFKVFPVIFQLKYGLNSFVFIIASLFFVLALDIVTLKGISMIFSDKELLAESGVQYIVIMIAVLILKSTVSIYTYYRLAKLSHEVLASIREKLLFNFFLKNKSKNFESGYLVELIQRHSGVYAIHYIQSILRVIVDGAIVVILSVYVAFTSMDLVFPAIVFVFIPMYFWLKFTKNKLKILAEKSNFGNLKITSLVSSLLVSKDEVQINGFPKKAKEIIEDQSNLITKSQSMTTAIMNGPKHIWEICFFMLAAWLIVFNSATGVDANVLQGASVGAAALLRIAPLLNSLTVAFNNVRHSRPSVEIVEKALSSVETNRKSYSTYRKSEKQIATVYFSSDVNHDVKGSVVVNEIGVTNSRVILIKGASGTGKTSLVRALVGINDAYIYDETLMQIKSEINKVDLIRWSSQEAVLIDDSIEENINLYGKLDNLSEGLVELSLATPESIEEFISRKITSSNNEISTGQVRRIGLLRALYSSAGWVVLDEPESGLDFERRIIVQKLLNKLSKNKKILLISHTDHFDQLADIKIDLD